MICRSMDQMTVSIFCLMKSFLNSFLSGNILKNTISLLEFSLIIIANISGKRNMDIMPIFMLQLIMDIINFTFFDKLTELFLEFINLLRMQKISKIFPNHFFSFI